MCVCVLFSTPPLVFIEGSNGVKLAEPPSATSEEMTRGEVEAVGPTGQVGRPSRSVDLPGPPTAPTSSGGLSWASLSDPRWGWPVLTCLNWVLASLLVHLSLNRCSNTTTELAIANGLSPPVHSEPLVMPHHRRVQSWWP